MVVKVKKMKKNIYCQLKDLEISIVRMLFNESKEKLRPPTITQARIMEFILKNKNNNIYQKDLEKELNLRRATVSEVLTTMEKKKIIKRVQNPNDARSKQIILQEKNLEKQQEIKNKLIDLENILIKDISHEELLTFSLVLQKMKKNIENKYNE